MRCLLRCFRRAPILLGLTSLLLVLPGCPLSPEDEDRPDQPEIRLDRTTPLDTIEYVATVWENKLYDEYEMVLHDSFEFFPKPADHGDLPWLPGDSWGRTIELAMAEHMFDPNYSNPDVDAQPVQTIEMQYSVLNTTQRGDTTVVNCTAVIRVMVGPADGWISDTRFFFDIVPDPDEPGLYQVIRQEEVEKT